MLGKCYQSDAILVNQLQRSDSFEAIPKMVQGQLLHACQLHAEYLTFLAGQETKKNNSSKSTKKNSGSSKSSKRKITKKSYYTDDMPDCDDYDCWGDFMDDWDGNMPDGSDASDYWDNW